MARTPRFRVPTPVTAIGIERDKRQEASLGSSRRLGVNLLSLWCASQGSLCPRSWPSPGRGVAVHWDVSTKRASQDLSWRKDGGPDVVCGEGDLWAQAVAGSRAGESQRESHPSGQGLSGCFVSLSAASSGAPVLPPWKPQGVLLLSGFLVSEGPPIASSYSGDIYHIVNLHGFRVLSLL